MDINSIKALFVLPEPCKSHTETYDEMQQAFEVNFLPTSFFIQNFILRKILDMQAE